MIKKKCIKCENEECICSKNNSGCGCNNCSCKIKSKKKDIIEYKDFEKLDIRVGRIIKAEDFPEAKKPTYRLEIDLGGDIGVKKSSVQVVKNYSKKDLINKEVLCIVNFHPKKIGPFTSEVLTLGVPDKNDDCILIKPDKDVSIGGKLY